MDQEKCAIWQVREGALHGIIPCMRRWMKARGRTLRHVWVVAAVLAVLIAAGEKGASATSYDAEELEFLQLINDYRASNGLGKLLLSDTLSVSSERHSEDMSRYRFFAHNTAASSYYPVGSTPRDRMRAEDYGYRTFWGENIAVGYDSAEAAFRAWRNSPSHNAAMLDRNYRVIGIARVPPAGPMHRWYWTTDFGGTVDPTAHAPGENPPSEETNEQQKERKGPVDDGPGLENGGMNGDEVWQQRATDRAELILDGHARLGDYDNGKDELRQKIRIGENTQLAYGVKITTDELLPPFDRLLVRLTDEAGREIAVLRNYHDAGGWRRERVDLSRFAGRTLYLSFYAETDAAGLTAFYVDDVVLNEDRDGS
jgi:uncharacterized protein YkwD